MVNEELKQHIAKVHQQLEDARIQSEDKDLLGNLMTELVKHEDETVAKDDVDSLQDALAEQTAKFENSHPSIAGAIREVMNALSNMGI